MPVLNGSKKYRANNPESDKESLNTDSLDRSLAYSLRRAQLSTYSGFVEAMQDLEIRPSQFAVLVLIQANPGVSQSAVSVELGIQKANFVPLLDKLELRGLTERRQFPGDRRFSALYLTKRGEQFVKRMQAAHDAFEAELALRLGPRRSRELLGLLHEFCG